MSWRRILADAPEVDGRNGVTYFEVDAKRVLNPVKLTTLPFELSLNPYLNCEIGCTYCFAREFSSKRQEGLGSFEREIYAKSGAPRLLARELARLERAGRLGKPIALGTATDPYQPMEKRTRLTRSTKKSKSGVEASRSWICTSLRRSFEVGGSSLR